MACQAHSPAVDTYIDDDLYEHVTPPGVPQRRPSAREREIWGLVARGMTQREVARAAGITTQTVKNHVGSLCLKLNVEGSSELIVLWYGGRPYSWENSPSRAAS